MSSILPFLPGSAADVLQRLFPGDSKMARCMRNFDWPQTGLGAAEAWPQSLKTSVRIMLASRQPTAVWWSEHFLHLYNDS